MGIPDVPLPKDEPLSPKFYTLAGREKETDLHVHTTPNGSLIQCYHACRNLFTNWKFWLGITATFPFEHALWEKVPPFSYVTQWLGL